MAWFLPMGMPLRPSASSPARGAAGYVLPINVTGFYCSGHFRIDEGLRGSEARCEHACVLEGNMSFSLRLTY